MAKYGSPDEHLPRVSPTEREVAVEVDPDGRSCPTFCRFFLHQMSVRIAYSRPSGLRAGTIQSGGGPRKSISGCGLPSRDAREASRASVVVISGVVHQRHPAGRRSPDVRGADLDRGDRHPPGVCSPPRWDRSTDRTRSGGAGRVRPENRSRGGCGTPHLRRLPHQVTARRRRADELEQALTLQLLRAGGRDEVDVLARLARTIMVPCCRPDCRRRSHLHPVEVLTPVKGPRPRPDEQEHQREVRRKPALMYHLYRVLKRCNSSWPFMSGRWFDKWMCAVLLCVVSVQDNGRVSSASGRWGF